MFLMLVMCAADVQVAPMPRTAEEAQVGKLVACVKEVRGQLATTTKERKEVEATFKTMTAFHDGKGNAASAWLLVRLFTGSPHYANHYDSQTNLIRFGIGAKRNRLNTEYKKLVEGERRFTQDLTRLVGPQRAWELTK